MEANTKQQQLTFDKGITNVPSDAICSDNSLAESVGMVYENGEHKVIQNPTYKTEFEGKLIFVHISNKSERYIITKDNKVYWCDSTDKTLKEICTYSGELSVDAVGNMLVISHGGGMVFARWKSGGYETDKGLPDFNYVPFMSYFTAVEAALVGYADTRPSIKTTVWPLNVGEDYTNPYGLNLKFYTIYDDGTVSGVAIGRDNSAVYSSQHNKEKDEIFQNTCIGYMEEYLDNIKKEGGFAFPFWVRFGIELYDGSVTKLSAPILMCPSVRYNGTFIQCRTNGSSGETSDPVHGNVYNNNGFHATADWSFLHFAISATGLTDMRNVIKSIKVYVSQEVKTAFINEENWDFHCPVEASGITYESDSVRNVIGWNYATNTYSSTKMDTLPNVTNGTGVRDYYRSYIFPKRKTDDQIIKELIGTSVFYELCEIPYEDIFSEIQWQTNGGMPHDDYRDGDIGMLNGMTLMAEKLMEHHALLNLTTLTQLPHDDYNQHTTITEAKLFTYNGRLNMFNIKRQLFDGFDMFMNESTAQSFSFRAEVHVQSDNGVKVVYKDFTSSRVQGYWFFYPDPRATKAILYIRQGTQWYELADMPLKEHPFLNGAYYFGKLPYDTGTEYGVGSTVTDKHYNPTKAVTLTNNKEDMEVLPNTIITTEVNNPMAYYAEGVNKVGDGTILGLATQTVALSSGTEFGSQPLIVFTDKGLWSMAVNNTGLYQSVHPMSREVCNNPDSITQTDGAVFFTSEKGLMAVAGSDVRCMSEQMSGREDGFEGIVKVSNFADYLRNCFIAYDYRDSLLWIFNQKAPTDYCYVYSIKTGTFARYRRPYVLIDNVVNNYPDYLIQATDGKVYSLIDRPNVNDDETDYEAFIITRPMKLENSLALKSIRQIRHITDMQGTLKLRLFASNNLRHWAELHSLRGTPWKYFRFRYDFQNLKATDRFSGSIVVTQERRTDKLR